MLSCREVADLVASEDWRTAPLRRRAALFAHLAMCRYCRAYARGLRRIGEMARRLYAPREVDPERAAQVLGAVRRAAEEPPSH